MYQSESITFTYSAPHVAFVYFRRGFFRGVPVYFNAKRTASIDTFPLQPPLPRQRRLPSTVSMSSTTATLARMAAQVRIVSRPVPKTLHESRQILLALQKFGEVLVFRNLKVNSSAVRVTDILLTEHTSTISPIKKEIKMSAQSWRSLNPPKPHNTQ